MKKSRDYMGKPAEFITVSDIRKAIKRAIQQANKSDVRLVEDFFKRWPFHIFRFERLLLGNI